MRIPPDLEAQVLRYHHVEKWRIGTIATPLNLRRCRRMAMVDLVVVVGDLRERIWAHSALPLQDLYRRQRQPEAVPPADVDETFRPRPIPCRAAAAARPFHPGGSAN